MHDQQINQLAAGEQSAVDRDEQWAHAIPAERQRNLCRADKRNRRRRERRAWGVDACTWRRGPPRQDASAGECERHRLTQQRERAELADPTGLDERDAAIGQPHTRRAQFEIAVMPEEGQVAVALEDSVMHRMPASRLSMQKASAGEQLAMHDFLVMQKTGRDHPPGIQQRQFLSLDQRP